MTLPAPGSTIAGKYRLHTLIGAGGMGSVYRAHHELMDKPVALKLLHSAREDRAGSKARFLREARASARIRHPHVVEVYDVGADGDELFMVMELLEGESFARLIGDSSVSAFEKLRLLLGSMRGVAAAHEQGIVHRDIKPENIFIVRDRHHPEGLAKVLDFGISKLRDDALSADLTESGITIGTPIYMSSEQLRGARDVDHRTDIYAFGVMLYETFSGQLPFHGETAAAIAVKMHTTRAEALRVLRPELPAALERVVMRAMALHPDDRYPSMIALIDALEPVVDAHALRSTAELPAVRMPVRPASHAQTTHDAIPQVRSGTLSVARLDPPAKAGSRARRIWLLLALVILTVCIGLAIGWQRGGPPTPSSQAVRKPVAPSAVQTRAPASVISPATPAVVKTTDAAPTQTPSVREPELAKLPTSKPTARGSRRKSALAPPRPVATEATPVPPTAPAVPAAPAAHGVRSGELRRDEL